MFIETNRQNLAAASENEEMKEYASNNKQWSKPAIELRTYSQVIPTKNEGRLNFENVSQYYTNLLKKEVEKNDEEIEELLLKGNIIDRDSFAKTNIKNKEKVNNKTLDEVLSQIFKKFFTKLTGNENKAQ